MYQLTWIFRLSTVILPRSKPHKLQLILQKTSLGQSRAENVVKGEKYSTVCVPEMGLTLHRFI